MVLPNAMNHLPGVFSSRGLAVTEIMSALIGIAAVAGLIYYFFVVRRRR